MKRLMRCSLAAVWGGCLFLGSIPAFGASGNASPAEALARFHYAGLQPIKADPNGTACKEIWGLPVSARFRDDILAKLGAAFASHLERREGNAAGSPAALIRPLLNDLVVSETAGEVIENTPGQLETVLAVHVEASRLGTWQANLRQLVDGWQWRGEAGQWGYLVTNSWVAVWFGNGQGTPTVPLLEKLHHSQRPVEPANGYWMKVHADLARCVPYLGLSERKSLPRLDMTINGRKESLWTEARVTFPEPKAIRLEKWEIPTSTIRDPLISFTACQGIASWLSQQPLVQELGLSSVPDQLYLWGLSQTPFQIQAAAPVASGSKAFAQIAEKWMPKWNQVLAKYAVGNMRSLTDRSELVWRGLPILVPYLEPIHDKGRDFLHAGIFPVNAPTNPPPAALFQQLNDNPKLLYYDWEITQSRLDQLRPLLQLGAVILNISPMSTNSAAYQWLDAVQPRLGNTATEMTVASPQEWHLHRISYLGFSGLELLTLANWMEGTNFPRPNPDCFHFRPVIRSSKQPKKP
jgi:hypothetical protein